MLFLVNFYVTQPANYSNQELIATWIREAEAAIGAMDAGAVPHLWKVAGERKVVGVVDVPTAEDLDRALGSLPIIREMGPGMKTDAVAIYDYRTFAQDLNAGAYGTPS
jgi:muconolactone delta-isomerase